jgi:hypothetical protein
MFKLLYDKSYSNLGIAIFNENEFIGGHAPRHEA